MPVDKNGYLYIYTSNETNNIEVFFDNLQVTHVRGSLLEETHYYPFGLTMAGISSKALMFGNPENKKNKFQGQLLDDDLGINYYGFKWRNHDPQIGRFIQIDPLSDKYVYNSTYAFSENKVTAHVELEGLESFSISQFNDATYQNKWRSESTNPNYQRKAYSMPDVSAPERALISKSAKKADPIITLNVSTGAVLGVSAGPVSYEVNNGTRELLSLSENGGSISNPFNSNNPTTSGAELKVGPFGVSSETVTNTKTMTVTESNGIVHDVDNTSSTTTNKLFVGLPGTQFSMGTQQTTTTESETSFGLTYPKSTSTTGSQPYLGAPSYVNPKTSTSSNGTKFSVAAGVKIEVQINFPAFLGMFHN